MPPPPSYYPFYGLCIYGFTGELSSNAMTSLATALNRKIPPQAHFHSVAGSDALDPADSAIEQELDEVIYYGAVPILIGHGLGGNMVVRQCARLAQRKVGVPIAGVIDPTNVTGNTIGNRQTVPGIWAVNDNVGLAINPYTSAYPGGGHVVATPGNSTTAIRPMYLPQYPHAAVVGYDIGSCPETVDAIVGAVSDYLKQVA